MFRFHEESKAFRKKKVGEWTTHGGLPQIAQLKVFKIFMVPTTTEYPNTLKH